MKAKTTTRRVYMLTAGSAPTSYGLLGGNLFQVIFLREPSTADFEARRILSQLSFYLDEHGRVIQFGVNNGYSHLW